ncbi:unnamed protein product [Bemisia tabaci]|uniref:Uncharacterized protein n=1 Tax=Bemisia tabaci TaxID=7038 RepID=A0A9P0EYC7_BEMTA|nr:unnamed protein product [Bemisia tabaci]
MPKMTSIKECMLLFDLILLAQTVSQAESGRIKIRKTNIAELHKQLRFSMAHDGCQQFTPLSCPKNPTFELTNNNCHESCELVNSLYQEHHKKVPRLILRGSCKVGLKLVFLQCKCELAPHYARRYFRWRTLQHCARKYLHDIVDLSVNDTFLNTSSAPELDSFTKTPRKEFSARIPPTDGESTIMEETENSFNTSPTSKTTTVSSIVDMNASANMTTRRTIIRKKNKPNKPWRKFG